MTSLGLRQLPPPHASEQALIDSLPSLAAGRLLCNSLGRAQLALAAAVQHSPAQVVCHFLDLYRCVLARATIGELPANLRVICTADFPDEEFDAVALATTFTGEAELTRDLLQGGHQRLTIGGQMLVATDNPRDTWLAGQMDALFDKVSRHTSESAVVYSARKTRPLKKLKDFSSEFAFRDRGTLIRAFSRPGVFSHRRTDPGARKLLDALELAGGERVLDIGCGWGAVAIAAALRAPNVSVLAIDSHARAVKCAQRCAELNGITTIETKLSASGEIGEPGTFDIVLANPPYYADFRIAELFATTGQRALRHGGQIIFVTKSPQWYADNLPLWFDDVTIRPAKDYFIADGRKGR
jgi:16S rRNA (guanine1207-N2)-methyltransferase